MIANVARLLLALVVACAGTAPVAGVAQSAQQTTWALKAMKAEISATQADLQKDTWSVISSERDEATIELALSASRKGDDEAAQAAHCRRFTLLQSALTGGILLGPAPYGRQRTLNEPASRSAALL
ncbi:MAG: hypothetical protein NVS1B14_08570 [Vulcanimicrobiaceae bacterium]